MRFCQIEDQRGVWPVRVMCAALSVSPSGYYAWRSRPQSPRKIANRALLRVHARHRGRYGAPRIHAELRAEGQTVRMRQNGIRARAPRRYCVCTTDSKHSLPVAPNLLDQNFVANRPNQVWLADITYIATGEGWLYLAVILDLFTRKVVGWAQLASDRGADRVPVDDLLDFRQSDRGHLRVVSNTANLGGRVTRPSISRPSVTCWWDDFWRTEMENALRRAPRFDGAHRRYHLRPRSQVPRLGYTEREVPAPSVRNRGARDQTPSTSGYWNAVGIPGWAIAYPRSTSCPNPSCVHFNGVNSNAGAPQRRHGRCPTAPSDAPRSKCPACTPLQPQDGDLKSHKGHRA
jgi:hypothetical protein